MSTAAVAAVREAIDDAYLGPSTAHIVAAATERGIPHLRLNDGNLVQLGHGARQHRIWTAETDRTSAIAEGIARDKDLTKQLLAAVGVPVPEGQVVASPAEAWAAAEDIGLPVVVKPTDGNHGRGVTLDLRTREQVEAAWAVADRRGQRGARRALHAGQEHRLLVVAARSWRPRAARPSGSSATAARRGRAGRRADQQRPAPRRHRGPSAGSPAPAGRRQ